MITENIGLVRAIAKKFHTNSVISYEDLIQEGCIALIKAAKKYNPDRGVRFSTVAWNYVRNHLIRYCNNESTLIRIPESQKHNRQELPMVSKSLDYTFSEAGNDFHDIVGEDSSYGLEQIENKEFLKNCFGRLTEKQKDVVFKYFFEEKNLAEIGREIGYSRSYVKKIKDKAIKEMQKAVEYH